MKTYLYDCDGGTLLVGNEQFTAAFPNGYGDGCFKVSVVSLGEEVEKPAGYTYEGSVSGEKFHIYADDCSSAPENILCTLSGTYGVYYKNGNMVLEQ